ncbi:MULTISPECIES: hypothetical protein [Nostoc]|uniref:Dynamin family protein n=2 Tax=Nostoc TaxID=1177 RepID=A0ABR8IKM3_9NOSO|nr:MULTISPECIES: hypothetical protein [Nostoc]MBD2564736.1 hypothetical protein [Nostoc linckia FACHB-391]MBD2650860.1 hypothetical protein [Nostoc foliaceum FACHB-393]
MPETVQSFLNQVKEAAAVLKEPDVIELIEAVKRQSHTSKLRLLIVGLNGSGRFSVANVLLKQPDLLPTSPIPKAPISVNVSYGEVAVEVSAKNGIRTVIPVEQLKTLLTSADTQANRYEGIEVKTNSNLLKTCNLRIENIDAEVSAAEWKKLLAGTEYVIIVLKSITILSEQERHFIRDILKPSFGLERVAIVLNQIDLVPEEDRSSISELVRVFLGSFESQPLLIEFSATQANMEITSGITTVGSGYATLSHLVEIDLLEQHSLLKPSAILQGIEICLTEVEERATRQIALIATSEIELQELIEKSDLESQWVKNCIQRAQQKIELFINTLIKQKIILKIQEFSLVLQAQLPSEVMPIKDVTQVRRYLPGYIEAVWSEFFKAELSEIRSKLSQEIKLISEMFENDLTELLGDKVAQFRNLVSEFDPTDTNLENFWMPIKPTSSTGDIALASGLGLQIFSRFSKLIFSLPFVDIAVGKVGEFIALSGEKAINQANKEAILDSVRQGFPALELLIHQQVENQFAKLTEELKKVIDDLYTEKVTKIHKILETTAASHQEMIPRKGEIEELISKNIPELRQLLRQLN